MSNKNFKVVSKNVFCMALKQGAKERLLTKYAVDPEEPGFVDREYLPAVLRAQRRFEYMENIENLLQEGLASLANNEEGWDGVNAIKAYAPIFAEEKFKNLLNSLRGKDVTVEELKKLTLEVEKEPVLDPIPIFKDYQLAFENSFVNDKKELSGIWKAIKKNGKILKFDENDNEAANDLNNDLMALNVETLEEDQKEALQYMLSKFKNFINKDIVSNLEKDMMTDEENDELAEMLKLAK